VVGRQELAELVQAEYLGEPGERLNGQLPLAALDAGQVGHIDPGPPRCLAEAQTVGDAHGPQGRHNRRLSPGWYGLILHTGNHCALLPNGQPTLSSSTDQVRISVDCQPADGQTCVMSLTANQLVAYNLMRSRLGHGWSQEQAAERLEPLLGVRWSKTVYSAAERSYQGKRVRQFSADELLAFSIAFGEPVQYFFLPPVPADRGDAEGVSGGGRALNWHDLLVLLFGGDRSPWILPRLRELPPGEVEPMVFDAQGAVAWREEMIRRLEDVEGRLAEAQASNSEHKAEEDA
jgi:hypothetical protein